MKTVVLICDEIGADYLNRVKAYLSDVAEVWFPDRPVSNSVQLLDQLQSEVLRRQPEVVHIGASLGDTRCVCCGSEERLIPLNFYETNVKRILRLIQERSTAEVIWGTIPPVYEEHFEPNPDDGESVSYRNDVIMEYNEKAREIVKAAAGGRVHLNDLYGAVKAASREDSWRPNGLKFCDRGVELLARKIEKSVRARL